MPKNKTKSDPTVQRHLEELKAEELSLFHRYNRHQSAGTKIGILNQLIEVIHKQDALNQL